MKIRTLIIMLILVVGILTFCTIQLVKKPVPLTEQDIVNDCANLSLKRTANCLYKNIHTFYEYDFKVYEPNFEAMRLHGGICLDWSRLYQRLGAELGFYSEVIYINMSDLQGHAITMISNNRGYCFLDSNTKPYCDNNFYVPDIKLKIVSPEEMRAELIRITNEIEREGMEQ